MRIRLLVTTLAYAVFLLVLLLFPPFHDGVHHFNTWQPSVTQVEAMLPAWADADWYRSNVASLSFPDRPRLIFEALIGLVSALFVFLLLELIARFRHYLRQDLPFCKSTLLGFLLDTH